MSTLAAPAPAAARGAAAATITPALLLPHDRIARAPLGRWAEGLAAALARRRENRGEPRRLASEVAAIANNAALIAAHAGAAPVARALCIGQIRWQLSLARRTGDPWLSGHALQPWINLARLETVLGETDAALARFARLAEYRARDPFDVDVGTISPEGWQVIDPDPEGFAAFLLGVYVIDALKALLQGRRWAGVHAYAAGVPPDASPGVLGLVREARVVASVRGGEDARARALLEEALPGAAAWERVVLELRMAETLACAGDLEGARRRLARLAAVAGAVSLAKRSELRVLHVLGRLCTACAETGLHDEAAALARGVLDAARQVGDESFEIEAARLLAQSAPPAERSEWRAERDRLHASTGYRRYRDRDAPPFRDPAVDRLFEGLRGLFAEA